MLYITRPDYILPIIKKTLSIKLKIKVDGGLTENLWKDIRLSSTKSNVLIASTNQKMLS